MFKKLMILAGVGLALGCQQYKQPMTPPQTQASAEWDRAENHNDFWLWWFLYANHGAYPMFGYSQPMYREYVAWQHANPTVVLREQYTTYVRTTPRPEARVDSAGRYMSLSGYRSKPLTPSSDSSSFFSSSSGRSSPPSVGGVPRSSGGSSYSSGSYRSSGGSRSYSSPSRSYSSGGYRSGGGRR